ncbi:MAG: NHLP bacteriocin system secretion protein [Gemmatimonadaceae bacterium]
MTTPASTPPVPTTPPPAPRFRASALQRAESTEGLDSLMAVTTIRGWVALAGLAALVVGALTWGILGRVPQIVTGQGIMVREGGLFRIQASGTGQIESVTATPGTAVRKGQTVAVLAQPELQTTIKQLESQLAELQANRSSTASLLSTDREMQLASIVQQKKQAEEAVAATGRRLIALDERIANEQKAVDKGLMTRDAAQTTIGMRAEVQLQQIGWAAKQQELSSTELRLQVANKQQLFTLDQSIAQTKNTLAQKRAEFNATANVLSPYDGIVVEQLTDVGQSIRTGDAISTLEPNDATLHVMMFIPLEGKRIKAGMRVEMVPGGVQPEETGYFLGDVRSVSSAPLSGSALDRYLKNTTLVQQFTAAGGAYLVDVAVELDSSTVSHFKWTSREGAPIAFGSGTLLTGNIVVETMRPIAMIMPAIRRWFGE